MTTGDRDGDTIDSAADSGENQLRPTGDLFKDTVEKFRLIVADSKDFFATFPLDEPMSQPLTVYGATLAVNLLCILLITIAHPAGLMSNLLIFAVSQGLWLLMACGLLRFVSGLFGGTGNLEQIVRGFCYANAPNVLSSIPFLNVFAWLYSLYLAKLVVERVEGLAPPRSNTVVGITAGITITACIAWMLLSSLSLFVKQPGG
jgi:hypothetical protein